MTPARSPSGGDRVDEPYNCAGHTWSSARLFSHRAIRHERLPGRVPRRSSSGTGRPSGDCSSLRPWSPDPGWPSRQSPISGQEVSDEDPTDHVAVDDDGDLGPDAECGGLL